MQGNSAKMKAALGVAGRIRREREGRLMRARDGWRRGRARVLELKGRYQAAVRAIEDACGGDDDDDTIDGG